MTLHLHHTLGFEFNAANTLVIAVVGIVVLGVAYFALRFWLVSTRPADIREVETPSLDRLNQSALEHMGDDPPDEEELDAQALENEEAPEGLKSAVPEPEKEIS